LWHLNRSRWSPEVSSRLIILLNTAVIAADSKPWKSSANETSRNENYAMIMIGRKLSRTKKKLLPSSCNEMLHIVHSTTKPYYISNYWHANEVRNHWIRASSSNSLFIESDKPFSQGEYSQLLSKIKSEYWPYWIMEIKSWIN